MKTKLKAFHGKQEIKDKYIARVKAHAEADEIIKGEYWENAKGCAVGCTIHSASHRAYEIELGIPRALAYLEDTIFEGMSNEEAMKFPLKFLSAIKVGADLSQVDKKFIIWLGEAYGIDVDDDYDDDDYYYYYDYNYAATTASCAAAATYAAYAAQTKCYDTQAEKLLEILGEIDGN